MEQTPAASPTSTQSTPTTLGDASAALAMADSSLATPAPETTAASDAPAATQQAQPTDTEQVPVSTDATVDTTKGEPPKWRWQDILANARETSAKEAEARVRQEVEQQYSGLKDFSTLDANERAGLLVWRAALNGDPQAIARLRSNPHVSQAIKGLFSEQSQTAAVDTEPEPDLQAADSTLVYSAPQLKKWQEWHERQLTSKLTKSFEEKLQPLQQTAQTFQQREAQATYTNTVSSVVAKMKTADPDFEKHMPDVGAALKADERLMQMATTDPEFAMEIAWNRVRNSKVLPAKQQQAEAQVLTNLQRQAVAATTNPATASATAPKQTLGDAHAALAHATATLGG
jgi:hypothetical protein